MRQVVGFGDWSTERGILRATLGRLIVTNGDFAAYLYEMHKPLELRFGVVRGVGRGREGLVSFVPRFLL